jgi:hypothetical protein
MRKGMDKALAAFACAVIIGALGAVSWHGDAQMSPPLCKPYACSTGASARDEVICEIEKLYSVWRSNDTGTGCREGAAGNP